MSALAAAFSSVLERVVMDQTGLAGGFDADAEFNPEDFQGWRRRCPVPDRIAVTAPSLLTAIEEQLGLKLESTRAPVDVLVIDHVEQPTPD